MRSKISDFRKFLKIINLFEFLVWFSDMGEVGVWDDLIPKSLSLPISLSSMVIRNDHRWLNYLIFVLKNVWKLLIEGIYYHFGREAHLLGDWISDENAMKLKRITIGSPMRNCVWRRCHGIEWRRSGTTENWEVNEYFFQRFVKWSKLHGSQCPTHFLIFLYRVTYRNIKIHYIIK